jgi:large conductance mechanosensitive channel
MRRDSKIQPTDSRVVKLINNLKKKEQAAPEPSKEELLLTEIRDLLKERK